MQGITKQQRQILEAVLEEQRQNRRGTTLEMIAIATNCKTPGSQNACHAAAIELMGKGHLGKTDEGRVGITAKGRATLQQAPPPPEPEPTPPDPAASEKQAPRKPGPSLGPWPTQKAAGRAKRKEGNPLGGWKARRELRKEIPATVEERPDNAEPGQPMCSDCGEPLDEEDATFLENRCGACETALWADHRDGQHHQDAYQEGPKINTPPAQHQADQVEAANEALQRVTEHAQQAASAFRAAVAAMNEAARRLEELRR